MAEAQCLGRGARDSQVVQCMMIGNMSATLDFYFLGDSTSFFFVSLIFLCVIDFNYNRHFLLFLGIDDVDEMSQRAMNIPAGSIFTVREQQTKPKRAERVLHLRHDALGHAREATRGP